MNEVLKQLAERKSVRVFTDEPIPEEAVQQILQASFDAPNAGNMQLYSIIRVEDPELKKRLAESCDHQPFIAEAKLVLVYCADYLKWYDSFRAAGCEPRDLGLGDILLAIDDALIAAQNAVTAAWSLGIGSCYIGDIMENCETQREILGLPEKVFPAAMLVFGYPTQQQKDRRKPPRFARECVVFTDKYHRLNDEELAAMFAPKAPEGMRAAWIQAFCKRKYNSDFSVEMSRSVEELLKPFRKEEE